MAIMRDSLPEKGRSRMRRGVAKGPTGAPARPTTEPIQPVTLGQAQPVHRLVALDLLRGLAALTVFFAHVRGASFVEFASLPASEQTVTVAFLFGLTRLGQEAVLTFFVLSGFLVGGTILTQLQRSSFDLLHYAIDRSTRIFLPLIPACLLTVILNGVFWNESVDLGVLLGNILGVNGVIVPSLKNNVPLWSLAYEIWFYVLAGAAGYVFSRRRRSVSLVAVATLALGTIVFSILSVRYLLYWAIAALMSLCLNIGYKFKLAVVGTVLATSGTLLHQVAVDSKFFTSVNYLPVAVSESILCLGIVLALPALCDTTLNERMLPLKTFASLISGWSYTLYLTHYPILNVLDLYLPRSHDLSTSSISSFAIRAAVSALAAVVLYCAFERNTGQLRRIIQGRIGKGSGTVSPDSRPAC
jgi:peptidoglycan/LPS O-acetylase OafA/YrhL